MAMTIGPTVEADAGGDADRSASGLALGTLAAVNRGRLVDRVIMACSVAGVSMAGVLHCLSDPVCRLQVGAAAFTGRTGPVWDGGLPSLILPSLTLGAVLIGRSRA